MIGRRLVNGVESSAISVDDRGLQYGDGLFETRSAQDGRVLEGLGNGTVKLIVTRGPGPRSYRPPADPAVTRIVVSSAPKPRNDPEEGIVVRLCDTPLGLNPRLAGIKHLNRLEQVLACAEWDDPAIAEGLMSSVDGRIVCATAANVFLVREGRLLTPAIRDCGVAGVMRGVVLAAAREAGIDSEILDLRLVDFSAADEVFLTNAITGVRPVGEILGLRRYAAPGDVTRILLERTARAGA